MELALEIPWWVYCAIPSLLWGAANLVDQHLARHYFKDDAVGLLACIGVFTFFSGMLVLVFCLGKYSANITEIIISVGLGAFFVISLIPYIKALQISEASIVVPLWQLSPVFTLIIAWFFLGEKLGIVQISAMALMIISAMGLVYNFETIKLDSKTLFLMFLACFGVGLFSVGSRYFVQEIHWLLFSGYTMIGYGVFSLAIYTVKPKTMTKTIGLFLDKRNKLIFACLVSMELLSRTAMILYQKALSIAPTAAHVQTVVTGLTPFYVFILTFFFAIIMPSSVAKIKFDKIFLFHVFCVCLMTFGLYLLLIKTR